MDGYLKLDRNRVGDRAIVGPYLLAFLECDPFCRELKSGWMEAWSKNGLLEMFSKSFLDIPPSTQNLIVWFMDRTTQDIQAAAKMDKLQMIAMISKLKRNDETCLENAYQLATKHNIEPDLIKSDFRKVLATIDGKEEKAVMMFSLFADALLHAEVRILEQVFEDWHGEKLTAR